MRLSASEMKEFSLHGGTDAFPSLDDWKAAFARIVPIDDIAIVAAPGHTEFSTTADAVAAELVAHVSGTGAYRFAVLDVPRGRTVAQALEFKSRVDSRFAALYYPWVVAAGADATEVVLPPSGFVCGNYARVDVERGVYKAPANEVVRGALRFERIVSKSEQDMLNPAGVNCLRFFEGRGNRVWGARERSRPIRNGNTSISGVTSSILNAPSTRARNGSYSSRMRTRSGTQ